MTVAPTVFPAPKRASSWRGVLAGRPRDLVVQVAALLALNLLAGTSLFGYFLANDTLYWDTKRLYSIFHNNLHSLNYFGEIQWWEPTATFGIPSYYISILAHNGATPLFVLVGFVVWVLGLIGIHSIAYQTVYVVYLGFLIPFLFSLGILLLARQLLTNSRAVLFVLVLAAFSPGVVLNVSDGWGQEQSTYAVYFASAYLHFFRKPSLRAFLWVLLTSMVMAAALNHIALFWNVLFAPAFVFALHVTSARGFSESLKRTWGEVPRKLSAAAVALVCLCALPSVITYLQGGDLLRTTLGTRVYDYAELRAGNPLEVLSISTPGIGYEWSNAEAIGYPQKNAKWGPLSSETFHTSFGYMGILSLPLVFLGFICGKRPWRQLLFLLVAVSGCVVVLSGYSPVFSLVLAPRTPLQGVNHYSDAVFRLGIYYLLLLAAGLGAEAVLSGHARVGRLFVSAFCVSVCFSFALFAATFALSPHPDFRISGTWCGFLAIMAFLFLVVVLWFAGARSSDRRQRLFCALLALTLTDVSTAAFFYERNVVWGKDPAFREPSPDTLGTGDERLSHYASELFVTRGIQSMRERNLDPGALPRHAFALAARTRWEDGLPAVVPGQTLPYLVLPKETAGTPPYRRFLSAPQAGEPGNYRTDVRTITYNGVELNVFADKESLLFWRDVYSPYWRATVDGKPVEIAKAFGAFKAVPVPKGVSVVEFRYRPDYVPEALAVSYFSLLAVAGAALWTWKRRALA